MDSRFGSMYERADAFYRQLGDADTHPLWMGDKMPVWFFVFILRYCTLLRVLQLRDAFTLAPVD